MALVFTQTWGVCSPPVDFARYLVEARSGDLVFFRARDIDLAHDLVSGFTHVGVVLRGGGGEEPRLLELRGGAEAGGAATGVSSTDLRLRVLDTDGAVFVARVRRPVDGAALGRSFNSLARSPYPARLRAHVAACKLWPAYDPGAAMMCSEFAMRVLHGAGVMMDRTWRCQTPSDVMAQCQGSGEYECASRVSVGGEVRPFVRAAT